MQLTIGQQDLLEGRGGVAVPQAMRMLVAVGQAMDAPDLIEVASAHIVLDAFAMGRAGADWIASLRAGGSRFVVPTTINAISFDRRAAAADDPGNAFDTWQRRMLDDCEAMGALATCSCNPFNQGITPLYGEHLAWSESATTAYVNSVIGAHTNREGATAIASALTGFTPRYGMHLPAARLATVQFDVRCAADGEADLNLLGALIARQAGNEIPVITGLTRPTADELFGFAASFAIVANLPMFHIVGVTPQASTVAAACGGAAPRELKPVTAGDLDAERARYDDATQTVIDLVTIGAPHASLRQIRAVADLIGSRKVREGIEFTLTTNASNLALAGSCGLLDRLDAAGVTVTADKMCFGCDLGGRKFGQRAVLATNSVKAALSAPGTRGVKVRYGTVVQCVEAAVSGRWMSEESQCS